MGRSPHGERGLKYKIRRPIPADCGSLPPRGAWIEMNSFCSSTQGMMSLPPRGAWIEIVRKHFPFVNRRSRSPHGERGLKCQGWRTWGYRSRRSPHGERGLKSVYEQPLEIPMGRSPHGERGLKYASYMGQDTVAESLPPRGAWIEILPAAGTAPPVPVAPPTGSVD